MTRSAVIGALVLVASGVAMLLLDRRPLEPHGPAATLQIAAVDDSNHLFANVDPDNTSRDLEIRLEDVPAGLDHQGHVQTSRQRYAFAYAHHGESAAQTRARLLHWLARFHLPAGEHFAAQDVFGTSPYDDQIKRRGARSYVLESPPMITSADVTEVIVLPGDHPDRDGQRTCDVDISFTHRGAQLFLDATRRLVKRRMAIVVDGVVASAPVVEAPVPGGHTVISAPGEDSCAEAHRLAASLRGQPQAHASR